MTSKFALAVLLASAGALTLGAAQQKSTPPAQSGKNAAFELFKQLAGEWVGKEAGKGGEIHVKYQVTSGGKRGGRADGPRPG